MFTRPLILDSSLVSTLHQHGCWPPRQYVPKHVEQKVFEQFQPWCLEVPELVELHHTADVKAGAHVLRADTFTAAAYLAYVPESRELVFRQVRAAVQLARRAASAGSRPVSVAGVVGAIFAWEGWANEDAGFETLEQAAAWVSNPSHLAWCGYSVGQMQSMYESLIRTVLGEGIDCLMIDCVHGLSALQIILAALTKVLPEWPLRLPVMVCAHVAVKMGWLATGASLTDLSSLLPESVACGVSTSPDTELARRALSELRAARQGQLLVSMIPSWEFPFYPTPNRRQAGELADFYRDVVRHGLADIVGGGWGTTPDDTRAVAELLVHPTEA